MIRYCKKILLLHIVACTMLYGIDMHAVNKYSLSSIDLSNLTKIKTTIASLWRSKHCVYRDKAHEYFYKVWGIEENFKKASYIRRCNDFLSAFELGIFNGICPLEGLIFDGELCCGYITKACHPVTNKMVQSDYCKAVDTYIIALAYSQPLPVINLLQKLSRIYQQAGYIFFDFRKLENLGFLDGNYYLIDLDDFIRPEDAHSYGLSSWLPIMQKYIEFLNTFNIDDFFENKFLSMEAKRAFHMRRINHIF